MFALWDIFEDPQLTREDLGLPPSAVLEEGRLPQQRRRLVGTSQPLTSRRWRPQGRLHVSHRV
jgi:hypothetical protein